MLIFQCVPFVLSNNSHYNNDNPMGKEIKWMVRIDVDVCPHWSTNYFNPLTAAPYTVLYYPGQVVNEWFKKEEKISIVCTYYIKRWPSGNHMSYSPLIQLTDCR